MVDPVTKPATFAEPPPLTSPIREKIAWAEKQFEENRDRLLGDLTLRALVKELERAVSASHAEMEQVGVSELCRICDEEEGGAVW